jgi:dolichyl-diphosphooligosaccharide--protein glycosyltransferase
MPGEFLHRSMLGSVDHHIANTLFTTVSVLFLILAIKTGRQRDLTFSLKRLDWRITARPIIYSLLAGIFLGIYLLTWMGALLFAFLFSLYFIIQFIIDHLKRKSTDYLFIVGGTLFFVTLLVFLPLSPAGFELVAMAGALLIPLALGSISWLMAHRGMKPIYYPLALIGAGLAGMAIFYAVNPSLLILMVDQLRIFMPVGVGALTTLEMQPFSAAIAWGNFTTGSFLSLISLVILSYLVIKRGDGDKTLLVVWSLVMLMLALGQRRFAYYLVVNVALLTGYLSVLTYWAICFIVDYGRGRRTDYMSWRVFDLPDFNEASRPMELRTRVERKRAEREKWSEARPTVNYTAIGLWLIVIFFLVFYPNIQPSIALAKYPPFAPTPGWVSALTWMRENTPDPFGDPNFYYQRHKPLPPGEGFSFPETAYGVLAWWDYGYWISRTARRIPNVNPGQCPVAQHNVASFFMSPDEDSAREIIQELGSRYIIVNHDIVTGKFWAIALWAGREITDFSNIYHVPQEGRLVPVQLFYPEYFRLLIVRLFNFHGKAVTPETTMVISYERVTVDGIPIRKITSVNEFGSYEEATAFLLNQESPNYRIVSYNAFASPVPLEALEHFKLIHSSDELVMRWPDRVMIPEVKIFEYLGHLLSAERALLTIGMR